MIKLLPEQISKYWDIIKFALEDSPPLTARVINNRWLNNILTSALSGEIEVWVSYESSSEIKLKGIVLTSFEIDKFIREKSLLIYYLYTFEDTNIKEWVKGLKSLAAYARSRGCARIVSYSSVDDIVSISKKLGGNTDTRFITFNLKD